MSTMVREQFSFYSAKHRVQRRYYAISFEDGYAEFEERNETVDTELPIRLRHYLASLGDLAYCHIYEDDGCFTVPPVALYGLERNIRAFVVSYNFPNLRLLTGPGRVIVYDRDRGTVVYDGSDGGE